MNKKARLLTLVLVVAMLVVALVPNGGESTAKPAKAQDPVEIRIYVGVGTGYLPYQQDAQNALAEQWNSSHDDIKVVFEFHDNETARDELLTQVAGGNAPDIVGPAGVRTVFEASELWLDISEYVERDAEELALDDFDPGMLSLYELGDRTVALPLGVYPSMMYVNETLFEEAGVELPPTEYGAWTWDDVRTKGIAITRDVNGVYNGEEGFDPENIEIYGINFFWTNYRATMALFSPESAGVVLNDDGTATATFNQEAILGASQFIHDGIFVDHFIPSADVEGTIGEGVANPFASNRFGMGVSHTWLFGGMRDAMQSGAFTSKWNVYPVPTAPNGVTTARVHADTFAIMQDTKNPDAAWEVLKWLTSPETALELAKTYGAMPARTSIRSDWEASVLADFPFLNLNVVYEALFYVDAPNHEGYMPNFARAWDRLETFWGELRNTLDMNVQEALEATNADVQSIFDTEE